MFLRMTEESQQRQVEEKNRELEKPCWAREWATLLHLLGIQEETQLKSFKRPRISAITGPIGPKTWFLDMAEMIFEASGFSKK